MKKSLKNTPSSRRRDQARARAFKLVEIVLAKKAKNPVILDIRGRSNLCDYFVICSGETPRQVRAIYELIRDYGNKDDLKIHQTADDEASRWILVDFFDVVVHIFTEEARTFYNLEYLWHDAKQIRPLKKKKK